MSFSLISDQKKKKIVPQKVSNCQSYPPKKKFFNFWFYFSNLRTLPEIILYYDQTKPNHLIRGSDFRLLYSNICHSATLGTGLWACFGTYNVPYRASTDIFFQSETSLIVINESNTSAPKSAKLNSHRLWTLFLEICIVEFLSLFYYLCFLHIHEFIPEPVTHPRSRKSYNNKSDENTGIFGLAREPLTKCHNGLEHRLIEAQIHFGTPCISSSDQQILKIIHDGGCRLDNIV